MAFVDNFLKTSENTRLSIGEMHNYQTRYNTYDHKWYSVHDMVYFCRYGDDPLKWRILNTSTIGFNDDNNSERWTMLLDCNSIIMNAYGKDKTKWKNSLMNFLIQGFKTQNNASFKFIVPSYKANPAKEDNLPSYYKFEPLNHESLFILDVAEVKNRYYGYVHIDETLDYCLLKPSLHGGYQPYWLRSPISDTSQACVKPELNGYINIPRIESNEKTNAIGISPACNIDVSRILFSSKVSENLYRLTFWDDKKSIVVTAGKQVTIRDNEITVPFYTSGKTDAYNAFSIMILDKEFTANNTNNAKLLYYKSYELTTKVKRAKAISFKWPSGYNIDEWGEKYRVYILAENISPETGSDYASKPYEILADSLDKEVFSVSFDLGGKICNEPAPATQKVLRNGYVSAPETPSTQGYDFKGWYNGSEPYCFNARVTSDLTLVAKWQKSTQYNLWIGNKHVSNLNCKHIPLDQGSASYDPETNILTFYNALITTTTRTYKNRTTAIYAIDLPLTIKGSVDIKVPEADHSIFVDTASAITTISLTLDGDITTYGSKYAIMAYGTNIRFTGGKVEIKEARKSALVAAEGGNISFADNMAIFSPEGSTIKRSSTLAVLYEKNACVPSTNAFIYSRHPRLYEFWVGRTKVSASNQKKIKCDKGYATYDPETGILEFKDAVIRHGHKLPYDKSAAVYSRNIPLIIKGNLKIDDDELDCGIRCDDLETSDKKLTLDGNITMLVKRHGVYATNKNVDIAGGCLAITTCTPSGLPIYVNGEVKIKSGLRATNPDIVTTQHKKISSSTGYSTFIGNAEETLVIE